MHRSSCDSPKVTAGKPGREPFKDVVLDPKHRMLGWGKGGSLMRGKVDGETSPVKISEQDMCPSAPLSLLMGIF